MSRAAAILVLLIAFGSAGAASTQPATRPAVVDLSSPDAAIRSMADALDQNDVGAFLRIMADRSDDEKRLIAGEAKHWLLGQRLMKAIREHIPDAKMDELTDFLEHFGMPVSGHGGDELRKLLEDESIKWKVTGDDAVLGEVVPEIHLRKIQGQWRMVLPHDERPIGQNLKEMQQYADLFEDVIHRIDGGEVKAYADLAKLFYGPTPNATSRPTTGAN